MRLYTAGLLSKWGFGDGDVLDDMIFDSLGGGVDYSKTLIKVVREFVVPKIKNKIELQEIGTIHNPIRASMVDGIEVDWIEEQDIELEPEFVDVPDEDILRIAKEFIN